MKVQESVMPSNHIILCWPLLLLPSIFPSIRVFSNELALIRWPKYWSFSFSISPYNVYSGLISLRIYWFDLLAVQGTLEWHWNMYNIIYQTNRQSRFNAWYWMLGAGTLRWPRGMVQGGSRKGGSGWGTRVYPWQIHVDVWQNQYNTVK